MPEFNHRSQELEIMDDLACSGEVVHQTLRELEIINRWLGGNKVTLEGIRILLKKRPSWDRVTIADLGCGGGEMLKLIARWAKENDLMPELTGIDANPNIIAFAAEHSKDHPEIAYFAHDVFSGEFKKKEFDIVLATLFTHHFSDLQLIDLLKTLSHQARIGIVINDIHRHWLAYHAIRLLTALFSRSAMVRFDAPLSVLRAFRRRELENLLAEAGIENYILRWKWAFRWQLIIPANG